MRTGGALAIAHTTQQAYNNKDKNLQVPLIGVDWSCAIIRITHTKRHSIIAFRQVRGATFNQPDINSSGITYVVGSVAVAERPMRDSGLGDRPWDV